MTTKKLFGNDSHAYIMVKKMAGEDTRPRLDPLGMVSSPYLFGRCRSLPGQCPLACKLGDSGWNPAVAVLQS